MTPAGRLLVVTLLALLVAAGAQPPQSTSTTSTSSSFKRSFTNPLGNETFFVLAECHDTGGEYTYLEVIAPADTVLPFHHHPNYDELMEVMNGEFHTTIDGVNRTYYTGESFVFPLGVQHKWWTSPAKGATVRIKLEPCFDGFHESIEIFSQLPEEMRKEIWVSAVLYNIGGTLIDDGPWYARLLFWVLRKLAQLNKGKKMEQELRQTYIGQNDEHPSATTKAAEEGVGGGADEL